MWKLVSLILALLGLSGKASAKKKKKLKSVNKELKSTARKTKTAIKKTQSSAKKKFHRLNK